MYQLLLLNKTRFILPVLLRGYICNHGEDHCAKNSSPTSNKIEDGAQPRNPDGDNVGPPTWKESMSARV